MHLVLARHGNTFEPGEKPLWIGARTDLPLVSKGREQAAEIGKALRQCELVPRLTVAGPLRRTRETARLALTGAGVGDASMEIDHRLSEIDYGEWEAKTSEEIRAAGWKEELRAWDEEGHCPLTAQWPLQSADYLRRFMEVLRSLAGRSEGPVLIVSSNGLFKIFAKSLSANVATKMATGHMALLKLRNEEVDVLCWNMTPSAFADLVHRHVKGGEWEGTRLSI